MANRTLPYRDGPVNLKGYLAHEQLPGPRPGVGLFPKPSGSAST